MVPLMWQFIAQVTPLFSYVSPLAVFKNALKTEKGPTHVDLNKEHSMSTVSPGFWNSR